ncbi:ADP-ribosylglycohydrolase family protein [Corynebacterium sp.]|uniref:ADP-ribosylglycohydrolase family protein n=1 Tax=Corynebacterium sp. TaxID=1720 RepID=UPI0026DF7037|nr:ADP-ribosylglycohydrolase family protein [Corynebacterium sp.]MDO5511765.1 ADP-ribosylglycohydrolase family protein [Corynebacterium sp.]
MTIRDRALGAWYGQLIGDNLGALVEFRSPAQIAAAYPEGVREMADGGTHNIAAGQPTDDSEMALALARSMVRQGGYDRADVLDSYRRWYNSHPFDIGATISSALRGQFNENSQANGALMRISPVAIAYHSDPAQAASLARTDAALTHPNSYCLDVNSVWTGVLAGVIRDGADPLELFRLYSCEGLYDEEPGDTSVQQGWVRHAFTLTVHEAARGDSFEEALVRTIGRGGDTDTNAAIVGAFLGGVHGVEAIPQRWRDVIDTCRPIRNRPAEYHPNDATELVDSLLGIV